LTKGFFFFFITIAAAGRMHAGCIGFPGGVVAKRMGIFSTMERIL